MGCCKGMHKLEYKKFEMSQMSKLKRFTFYYSVGIFWTVYKISGIGGFYSGFTPTWVGNTCQ